MTSAIMTKQAVHRTDAQKHGGGQNCLSVHRVLSRPHRDRAADDEINLPLQITIARGRDHFSRDLVIALIISDGILDIEVESIAPADVTIDIRGIPGVLEQI